jgi:hypothetical protein
MGISVGVSPLSFFIGMVIWQALAGVLMQGNHNPNEDAGGALGASYPAPRVYNMIFFATGLLAAVSLASSVMPTNGLPMQKVGGDAIAKH